MKKSILILVTALFLLAGCNKDNETTATIYWSLSTALCPGDVPDEVLSVAYLYDASNEKEFILNTYDYQPSDVMGDPVNYSIKEGWAELNTGEKEHYKYFSDELNSPYNYGEFKNVAPGRYLIVIFKEYNAFSNNNYFAYTNKYAAKYIDVKPGETLYLEKVMGGDITKKGFQEWEIKTWKCVFN